MYSEDSRDRTIRSRGVYPAAQGWDGKVFAALQFGDRKGTSAIRSRVNGVLCCEDRDN